MSWVDCPIILNYLPSLAVLSLWPLSPSLPCANPLLLPHFSLRSWVELSCPIILNHLPSLAVLSIWPLAPVFFLHLPLSLTPTTIFSLKWCRLTTLLFTASSVWVTWSYPPLSLSFGSFVSQRSQNFALFWGPPGKCLSPQARAAFSKNLFFLQQQVIRLLLTSFWGQYDPSLSAARQQDGTETKSRHSFQVLPSGHSLRSWCLLWDLFFYTF